MRNYKHAAFAFVCLAAFSSRAQTGNVGIGTNTPPEKLTVYGSLQVAQNVTKAVNTPADPPSYNLQNITIAPGDSVFRIYDPGGPAGNYFADADTFMQIVDTSFIGYELTTENIQLGTGDTLSILSRGGDTLILCGGDCNGNLPRTVTGSWIIIRLKTNADVSLGQGFSLLVKRLYPANTHTASTDHPANALVFDPNRASFRSGVSGGYVQGIGSTAMGFFPYAKGKYSVAIGNEANAFKDNATVIGSGTAFGEGSACFAGGYAGGDYSITIGGSTRTDGVGSVAMSRGYAVGDYSTAVSSGKSFGEYSFAAGFGTSANGQYSQAFGVGNRTDSYAAMVLGRYSDYKFIGGGQSTNWIPNDLIFFIGDGESGSNFSNCFEITKNGNGWMQGTLTQASDSRLKTGIHPLTGALDKVLLLNGYNYQWENTEQMGDDVQSGILAQEVQAVMPELVKEDAEKMLSVNYSGLIPYLIEAVKELKKENEELRAMIEKKKRKKN